MASATSNYDVLIIGGGVIGLSLAWELAQHDAKVCVVDRGQLGQEASWAGAGMVPPGPDASRWDVATPFEQLEGLSQRLHADWHQQLLELTEIDSEYRLCGTIEIAQNPAEAEKLDVEMERYRQLGVACHQLDATTLAELEPVLASTAATFAQAYHLPAEAKIRNPRHLRALIAACRLAGVDLRPGVGVTHFEATANRLQGLVTTVGPIQAEHYCLAAGSWSGELAASLDLQLEVRPIRGQIVLLAGSSGRIQRNINVGPRYLVSRQDGRILVGSTQEDVGFNKENTAAGVADLLRFAESLSSEIAQLPIETRWSGLRPGTADGLPFLGRLPHHENGWLATGHFRAGLQLSPATAVVMRSMILGQESPIDVTAFGAER